jgi:hypothetical protein
MLLSDALVIARKRGRGVRRMWWSHRRLVIAWDDLWVRERGGEAENFQWLAPRIWTPTLDDLLATNWETCRP